MKVRYEHENKDPHATRARRVSAAPREQRGGPAIPVLYRLWPQDPAGHRYRITLTVAEPAADGQRLSLPAWIPAAT